MQHFEAFALIEPDGTIVQRSGVVAITRLPATKTYVIELERDYVPDRTHVSASCRTLTTPPATRVNTGMVDARHAAVTFLDGNSQPCDMRFTIAVTSF